LGRAGWGVGWAVGAIERFTRGAPAGRIGGDRKPAAAKRLWRPRRIRVLAGIEGVAAASARPCRLLHHRRGTCDLALRISLLLRGALLGLRVTAAAPRLGVAALSGRGLG